SEERSFVLVPKTVTDIALVGFSSSAKSSLIVAISAMRSKLATYPFTTLLPILGVVVADCTRLTVADVPVMIPVASLGNGLCLEFILHVVRTHALVYVLDAGRLETDRDHISDYDALIEELGACAVEPILTEAGDQLIPLYERH